jgi:hypothetical protein
LIVWRKAMFAQFRVTDSAEAEALSAIAAGLEFGAMCIALAEERGPDAALALAGAWLGQWLQDGLIIGVSAANEATGR